MEERDASNEGTAQKNPPAKSKGLVVILLVIAVLVVWALLSK